MIKLFFRQSDLELLKNIDVVREYFKKLVRARKLKLATEAKAGTSVTRDLPDVLNALLEGEVFAENEEALVDELLELYISMAITASMPVANMIMYLNAHNKAARDKLQAEIYSECFEPWFKQHGQQAFDLPSLFGESSAWSMPYLERCFNESLRLEHPFVGSIDFTFDEDIQLGKFHIPKKQLLVIYFIAVHMNPEQWQRPNEYLPERFDAADPLSLTPTGTRRHKFSFIPFLGGKRMCPG
jgi:cytochrome P450